MFLKISPEKAGIPSSKVLEFIKVLEQYKLNTHSILMARGNNIFAETYYAPFDADFKHRMYSVSKSFVAIAVGLAEQEGLLSLEDKFIKYFPEYRNEQTDNLYEETTIRDLLTMRSCIAEKSPDWWAKEDRTKTYFDMSSNKIPGTNFSYDSTGSMILGCIVEKLTGKPFMEYLKEKLLLDIGFSKDAYCLMVPGGYSHSDSGVMCTSRELLAFARFDNENQMLTVINMSDKEQIIKLPVWTANVPMTGVMERLMKITEDRYNVGRIQYAVNDGMIELRMDPMSCKVLRSVK